ncbi:MAG: hypothetical protein ACRD8A_06730 [Candidatus Acidiferrales bacterium]
MQVVVAGLCVAAIALVQSCSNRRDSFYSSLVDAKNAGEIDRGWIPDYLPASSHAIHIVYDPESPRTWCAFEFSPSDAQGLQKNLTHVDTVPARVKHLDGPGESWWPDFLTGGLDLPRIRSQGFDLYVAAEPDVQSNTDLVLFVLDSANGQGFFYRTTGQ